MSDTAKFTLGPAVTLVEQPAHDLGHRVFIGYFGIYLLYARGIMTFPTTMTRARL